MSAENALWFVGPSNPSCSRAPGFNNNVMGTHETDRERDGNRELLHGNQLDDRQVWGQHCPAIREWHDGNMLLIPYSLPGDRKTRCCCLTELQLRGSPLLPFPRHLLPCNYQHIRKKKKKSKLCDMDMHVWRKKLHRHSFWMMINR